MKMVRHGGGCCGMRHIFGMGHPDQMLGEYKGFKMPHPSNTNPADYEKNRQWAESYGLMYQESFPQESYVERLKRHLLFAEKTQSSGLIEVVVVGNHLRQAPKGEFKLREDSQAAKWAPFLGMLGFRLLNPEGKKNSNSSNHLYIWHYETGIDNPAKWDSRPEPYPAGSETKAVETSPVAQDAPMPMPPQ